MLWAVVTAVAFSNSKRRLWLLPSAAALSARLLSKPFSIGFALPVGYARLATRASRVERQIRMNLRELLIDSLLFAEFGLQLIAKSLCPREIRLVETHFAA